MATNPFFYENRAQLDHDFYEDIIIETIQIAGYNCYYVRKTFTQIDKILGEDQLLKFTDAHLLEMYIENIEGYGGEGQIISKFGIEVKNKITFIISQSRFMEETQLDRPYEGDLIWFPLSNCFFEILFVEDNIPFFEMGNNYTYKLQCQTWNYSHENIDTKETILDSFTDEKKSAGSLDDNEEFKDFGNDSVIGNNIFGIKIN